MTPSVLRRCLLVFAVLGCLLSLSAQDAGSKVLFLGNSITKHGPKADIDWTGNWGMAASAETKDFVHLVTAALAAKSGEAPEVMVKNIADYERTYLDYNLKTGMKEAIDFQADLIVLAIGENVPRLATPEDVAKFQSSVTKLLTALKGDKQPTLLVRSCFWANASKDDALRQACAAVGGIFVDISALAKDEANYARAERPFKHSGVANHPGDTGMAAIATAIIKGLAE